MTIEHHAPQNKINWKVEIQQLDYHHYLPLFLDGLRELEEPHKFLAFEGTMNLLARGGNKILPCVPQCIMPLKTALATRDPRILCLVMQVIQTLVQSADLVGEALVPYYRQLLPVFNLFVANRINIGDQIDYAQRKKENLGDLPDDIITGVTVFGVSSLAESCEAIGTNMPKQFTVKQTNGMRVKHGRGKALAMLGSVMALISLLAFNVPFQSLANSYQYEQAGQLRMLRMEMRDIRRQKNWVATNALYFFEVMYLSAKSKKMASAITIQINAEADANGQIRCRDFNGQVMNAGRLPTLPDSGCKVTFEVMSHADDKIRIWLAVIDRTNGNDPIQLLKNGAEIAPRQQFFTPAVVMDSSNFDLIAAISDRHDAAWRSWFDNLVNADSIESANIEIDRLKSTGVGIFQARWRPYKEID